MVFRCRIGREGELEYVQEQDNEAGYRAERGHDWGDEDEESDSQVFYSPGSFEPHVLKP